MPRTGRGAQAPKDRDDRSGSDQMLYPDQTTLRQITREHADRLLSEVANERLVAVDGIAGAEPHHAHLRLIAGHVLGALRHPGVQLHHARP